MTPRTGIRPEARDIQAQERPNDDSLHAQLSRWNRLRLEPNFPTLDPKDVWEAESRFREWEAGFLEEERLQVGERAAAAPEEGDAFMKWFAGLQAAGPGQGDPLFPWLAEQADIGQMTWFLSQEAAGEAGFDDLVAMTQVKMPARAKLEMARNYWDEMGHGQAAAMHGALLEKTVSELGLRTLRQGTVWESVALSNLMVGLACNRRYAYHSVGALGAVEMTAPGRVAAVNQGLLRLGLPASCRHYFALHASLDVKHSAAWNSEVIRPLATGNPWIALAIAEGALMRLRAGFRCFERYRRHFGLSPG